MPERQACGPTGDDAECACGCSGYDERCDYYIAVYEAGLALHPEHRCCRIPGPSGRYTEVGAA
jgi:hypothetical protein